MNLKKIRLLKVAFLSGLFGTGWIAWGATYNFYFNNTEQGNNSSATPTLTVSDGKSTGPTTNLPLPGATSSLGTTPIAPTPPALPNPPAPTANSLPATPAVQNPPALVNTAQVVSPTEEHSNDVRHWRLLAGAVTEFPSGGPELEFGYFLTRDLGINLYAADVPDSPVGLFAGVDLEFLPFKISLGRADNLIQLGFLVGASTNTVGNYNQQSSTYSNDNWASMHVGARAVLNLGDQWGLTVGVRANLSYVMGDAGIAFRL